MASGSQWLKKSNKGLSDVGSFLGHFLLLAVRIYWGFLLIKIGFGKWLNAPGMAEFFAELNIPYPYFTVLVVGFFEILGGSALFLGLFARVFSIPLMVIFVVAYLTAHQSALSAFFADPTLFLSEKPFLFLYASLLVFCFGPGVISIDYLIERRAYGHRL